MYGCLPLLNRVKKRKLSTRKPSLVTRPFTKAWLQSSKYCVILCHLYIEMVSSLLSHFVKSASDLIICTLGCSHVTALYLDFSYLLSLTLRGLQFCIHLGWKQNSTEGKKTPTLQQNAPWLSTRVLNCNSFKTCLPVIFIHLLNLGK